MRSVLLLLPLLLAMGTPEPSSWVGRVSIVGSEPFTRVALTSSAGQQWRLTGEAVAALRAQAQGHWVKVSGKLIDKSVLRADSWSWLPEAEVPK